MHRYPLRDWRTKLWSEPWSMFLLCECEQSRLWRDYTHVKHIYLWGLAPNMHAQLSFGAWELNFGLSLDQCSYCDQSRLMRDYNYVKHTFVMSCSKHACTAIPYRSGGLNFGLSLHQCSYFVSVSSQGTGETTNMWNTYFVRSCSKNACTAISCETGGLNFGLSLDQCSYIVSVSSQG